METFVLKNVRGIPSVELTILFVLLVRMDGEDHIVIVSFLKQSQIIWQLTFFKGTHELIDFSHYILKKKIIFGCLAGYKYGLVT